MSFRPQARAESKKLVWTGRVISALVILFLAFDAIIKFAMPAAVIEAFDRLGLPEAQAFGLGCLLLACTALYAIPQTSIVGALLLTGYLGGAIAIHLRVDDPLFSHVLFPVYLGVLAWTGLALRDHRLWGLLLPKSRNLIGSER